MISPDALFQPEFYCSQPSGVCRRRIRCEDPDLGLSGVAGRLGRVGSGAVGTVGCGWVRLGGVGVPCRLLVSA